MKNIKRIGSFKKSLMNFCKRICKIGQFLYKFVKPFLQLIKLVLEIRSLLSYKFPVMSYGRIYHIQFC